MWVLFDRLGLILFDATLSTAVLLSLAILAILVCRQPARRLLIARVALRGSLLMLPLVALVPLPRLDIVHVLTQFKLDSVLLSGNSVAARAEQIGGAVGDLTRSLPLSLDLDTRRVGNWLVRGLTLFDLAGIGMGLAWLVLGVWGMHWLIRQSHEPTPETRALYDRLLAGGPPILGRTALRVSERLRRPAVVGFFRPTILIPASFDAGLGDPDQLRLSLLHEMAHVQQSDHWHGALASLAQTAWFLLPHVWWLRSQLRIDQEFLADRFAASRYGSSSGYAASLLLLAGRPPESGPDGAPNGWNSPRPDQSRAGRRSPLFQRLLMLLYCPHRIESRAPGLWSLGLRVIVVGLTLFAACLYVRWPQAGATFACTRRASWPKRQPFRVADFVATPACVSPNQRCLPYVLPIVLPDRYDLKVAVFARRSDLARTRIVGHLLDLPRLQEAGNSGQPSQQNDAEFWHQVRLVREGQDLHLWVDGHPLPVTMKADQTTESLTVEPSPERAIRFHNLVVEW
jgi:beta-lactamase regulating signal transducer with metallopeptidase domain